MPYIILAQLSSGNVTLLAQNNNTPTTATIFQTREEAETEIQRNFLLQVSPTQIVKVSKHLLTPPSPEDIAAFAFLNTTITPVP